MKNWIRILAISTAITAIGASGVHASVTGTVKTTDGTPVSGAVVTFIDEEQPEQVYRGSTDNAGQYDIYLTSPTGAADHTPSPFSLGQNYPNPFNPRTTIPFTLDSPGQVSLTIYNIMGQRITRLVDDYLHAGDHAIVWDGSDDHGNHMSAGVYLYQLKAGRHQSAKKMLLLDGGMVSGGSPVVRSTSAASIRRVAEPPEGATFTVTIQHESIVDHKETGVVYRAMENTNFVVIERGQSTIVNDLHMIDITGGSVRQRVYATIGMVDTLVTLSSFQISAYEITQAQYETIMGTNPSTFKLGDDYPVENVSRNDAIRFCNALSEIMGLQPCYREVHLGSFELDSGNGFRLPTATEWEYACKAGTETAYYTGDSEEDLARAGWYAANSDSTTHPVGQKVPNQFGLYDMHGNVWEWVTDYIAPPYAKISSIIDYHGYPGSGPTIYYGGSYAYPPVYCESGSRRVFDAGPPDLSGIGFRVVRRPDGYGVESPVESPVLQSFEVIPGNSAVPPGDFVAARFQVRNPNRVATEAQFALQFNHENGMSGEFIPQDKPVYLDPGTKWYARAFMVPLDMADGALSVSAVLLDIQGQVLDISPGVNDMITVAASDTSILDDLLLIQLPGGTFTMGDISGNGESNEVPVHDVTLSPFMIGAYEITQAQFEPLMLGNPSRYRRGGDYPVENVTWQEAVRFCNRLSDIAGFDRCYDEDTWECDFTKNGYRLPTEAEWEYACRAGTETDFYTGNRENTLELAAWFRNNMNFDYKPRRVGQRIPNNFGLYDMHGNVMEWCNDIYYYESYASSPSMDPTGTTWGSDHNRVFRGGYYDSHPEQCRSAKRYSVDIWVGSHHTQSEGIGFRVVRRPETYVPPIPEVRKELTFVTIPADSFQMGDITGDGWDEETPVHTVRIDEFEMSAYEITQYQYEKITGENPSQFTLGDDYPVEMVSWIDAAVFCNALSAASGYYPCYDVDTWECDFSKNGYRLPTEAEWEYACRAGTATNYYAGDTELALSGVGWFEENSDGSSHPVAQKLQNPFGLYDMHGNVMEWCNDWYLDDYYSISPQDNPTGPLKGYGRVTRGGHWGEYGEYCRSASRMEDDWNPDSTSPFVGFRVVRRP